eukprot:357240-Chlamydomonas_euryale.AAC.2
MPVRWQRCDNKLCHVCMQVVDVGGRGVGQGPMPVPHVGVGGQEEVDGGEKFGAEEMMERRGGR